MTSRLRRLCTRPLAALGGVALLAAVSAAPSVSGASTVDGDGPSGGDPDDARANATTTGDGTFESCSGLFGFGKAFVAYDVLVDGEDPATPLTRGVDYDLLLTGDFGGGSSETCIPEELTEEDWNNSVFGPAAADVPFPGANHLVLPFPLLNTSSVGATPAVAIEPFTLSIVEVAAAYDVVVGEQPIENSASLPAILATASGVAVDVIGEAGLAAIGAVTPQNCGSGSASDPGPAAAVELFDSMDAAFQADWLTFGGGQPSNCNSFFEFVNQYYPQRWVSYLLGTTAPAVFDLTVRGPAPTPPAPTPPAPTPDTPAVAPRYTG